MHRESTVEVSRCTQNRVDPTGPNRCELNRAADRNRHSLAIAHSPFHLSAVSVPRSSSSASSPFGVPLPCLLPLTPAQTGTWRTVTRSRRPLGACDGRRLRRKIHHDRQLHWLVRLVADAGVHGDESRSGGARGGTGGGGGGGGGSMRTARSLCPTRGLQLQMLLQQQQLLRRRLRLRLRL